MEYQALYRKYRPNKFNDVVDQESTLKIITNQIKEDKLSHAYLFSGPRGTGKTTIAKLVAKTVNCLNLNNDFSSCLKCENCLDIENSTDIIEIDAASNNGVDEIRELKSKINLVPNKLKYKVYIIDEVHMLSISAFNALLKTLEEPPSYVIFILATTEFYKVPATIISRCQCLNFTKIKTSSIQKRLQQIANLEEINIDEEVLKEIAIYSEGGMRDALGMLDKLASYSLEHITLNDFYSINGLISKEDMNLFINQILNGENEKIIQTLNNFDELGYDFSKLIEKLMQHTRDLLVEYYISQTKINYDANELYRLIMCFNEIYNLLKEAANRRIIVEVKLLQFINFKNSNTNLVEHSEPISQEIVKNKKNDILKQNELGNTKLTKTFNYQINNQVKRQRINNTFALASKLLKSMILENWKKLTNYLVDLKYAYAAGILKDCEVGVASNTNLILVTNSSSLIDSFYQNLELIETLLKEILDNEYKVILLSKKEFQEEVLNFKNHLNDKNYYNYQEEKQPLVNYLNDVEKKADLCYGNLVQKAIDVFGKEYIEIEEER